jgi:hypothetical protein
MAQKTKKLPLIRKVIDARELLLLILLIIDQEPGAMVKSITFEKH